MLNNFNISELSEEEKQAYLKAIGAWHLHAFKEDLGGYRAMDQIKQDAMDLKRDYENEKIELQDLFEEI